jgi:glycosyltransferase involved in cell wall biosynthesis
LREIPDVAHLATFFGPLRGKKKSQTVSPISNFMGLSIAQVISTGGFYGAERVMVELAAYLRDEGHDCRLAVLHSPGAEKLAGEAARRGLPATIIPCRGMFDRRSVRRLHDFLREHGCHIAHSHGYKSDLWLRLAAPPATRRVATAHAWYRDTAKLRFYEWLDKRCLRAFAHVVGVSPALLERLRAAGVAQSSMIANGLDLPAPTSSDAREKLRREFGLAPDEKLLARVGRLDAVKGNRLLLEALAQILPGRAARLLFVGEGEEEAALRQQARDAGLAAQVIFAGYRDDVTDLLRAADLFVSPSLSEGLPLVLLEAMAAEAPVVATNVGAVGSVVRPGVNGWLVPPNDAPALAAALAAALDAPDTARRLAANARQDYAANYSRAAMGEKYLRLYREILSA